MVVLTVLRILSEIYLNTDDTPPFHTSHLAEYVLSEDQEEKNRGDEIVDTISVTAMVALD
jgi:hypothetical protein